MDKNNSKGILEARIRQMAEEKFGGRETGMTLDDFDPKPDTVPPSPVTKEERCQSSDGSYTTVIRTDIEEYKRTFLVSRPFEKRTSFPLNRTTLDILKNILHDMDSRTSLSSFVENILLEHLHTYRQLINEATAEKIRKPTIPNI